MNPTITIRASREEIDRWRTLAESEGLELSTWIRKRCNLPSPVQWSGQPGDPMRFPAAKESDAVREPQDVPGTREPPVPRRRARAPERTPGPRAKPAGRSASGTARKAA